MIRFYLKNITRMQSDQSADISVMASTYSTEMFGELLSINGIRWGIHRKSQLIDAIRHGQLTFDEARVRYRLSVEELTSWQAFFDTRGQRGLRTTLIQQYRYPRRSFS